MAVTYGFYNSSSGDRVYNAVQMSSLFDGIIRDGVLASIPTNLVVVAAGSDLDLYVGEGRAWFNHTWTLNDTELLLTLDTAGSLYPRYDAVVLEVNESTRINSFKIIKGTEKSVPEYPTLTETSTVHQHPLCYIYVPANLTTLTQDLITNKVGTSVCPFVNSPIQAFDVDALLAQWDAYWTNTFLPDKDVSWSGLISDKEAAWTTFINGKDSAWTTFINGKDSAFNSWLSSHDSEWSAWVASKASEWASFTDGADTEWTTFINNRTADYNSFEAARMVDWTSFQSSRQAEFDAWIAALDYPIYIPYRQGGHATDWFQEGSTNYPVTDSVKIQVGVVEISFADGERSKYVDITFPEAFAYPPMAFVSCSGGAAISTTVYSAYVDSSPTTTVLRVYAARTVTTGTDNVWVNWLAIGY